MRDKRALRDSADDEADTFKTVGMTQFTVGPFENTQGHKSNRAQGVKFDSKSTISVYK